MLQVYLILAFRVAGISDEIMTDKQYLCKTLPHGHFWMPETKFFCFDGKTYPTKTPVNGWLHECHPVSPYYATSIFLFIRLWTLCSS